MELKIERKLKGLNVADFTLDAEKAVFKGNKSAVFFRGYPQAPFTKDVVTLFAQCLELVLNCLQSCFQSFHISIFLVAWRGCESLRIM